MVGICGRDEAGVERLERKKEMKKKKPHYAQRTCAENSWITLRTRFFARGSDPRDYRPGGVVVG